MEFITRLYFMNMYFPEKIRQTFDQQRAEAQTNIERLDKTLKSLPLEPIYNRMSIEMRLKQLRIVLEWLDECQDNFQTVQK
jgi:hypothetical protein